MYLFKKTEKYKYIDTNKNPFIAMGTCTILCNYVLKN